MAEVSMGVGGTEEDGVGIGLEGMLFGGAIGRVNERRFEFRDVVEVERAERVSLVAERGDMEVGSSSVSICFPSKEDRGDRTRGSIAVVLAIVSSATAVAVAAATDVAAVAAELDEAKMPSREEEAAGLDEPRWRHCCSKAICIYDGVTKSPKSLWNEWRYEACVDSWLFGVNRRCR